MKNFYATPLKRDKSQGLRDKRKEDKEGLKQKCNKPFVRLGGSAGADRL
jgi:hypothetical protein